MEPQNYSASLFSNFDAKTIYSYCIVPFIIGITILHPFPRNRAAKQWREPPRPPINSLIFSKNLHFPKILRKYSTLLKTWNCGKIWHSSKNTLSNGKTCLKIYTVKIMNKFLHFSAMKSKPKPQNGFKLSNLSSEIINVMPFPFSLHPPIELMHVNMIVW